jgi:hypothetical protein
MMTSGTYWHVAEAVREELRGIANLGDEMYANLETNDDPSEVAEHLELIHGRLHALEIQVKANIAPLLKVAKALDEVPGVKA